MNQAKHISPEERSTLSSDDVLDRLPRDVLDHLLEGCQIVGYDYRHLYVNEAAAQHGRTTRNALVGCTMMEVYPGIEETPMFNHLRRCMRERSREQQQSKFTFPDGSTGWFDLRFHPIPEGVFVLSIDITARKQAEQGLARSNRALTALSECNQAVVRAGDELQLMQDVCRVIVERGGYAMSWIGLYDGDEGSLRRVAQAARPGSGGSLTELSWGPDEGLIARVERTGMAVTVNVDAQQVRRMSWWKKAFDQGLRSSLVLPIRDGDVWFGVMMICASEDDAFDDRERSLLDQMVRDLGYGLASLRTQEAREHAERAERESRRKLGTLASHLPGMAYRCAPGPGWRMEIVSEGCVALTGYTAQELVESERMTYGELIHPDDRDNAWDEVQAAVAQDECYVLEYRILDVHGQQKWVWESGGAVRNPRGHVEALEGFITDITGRRRSEEETVRLNEKLRRLTRVIQELSAARTLEGVTGIVRTAARDLARSDGATFVLRDGDQCHYVDEDAIEPLWKGEKFPMTGCISGWVMLNQQAARIEDIYADDRIRHDGYRPTFVKSLVMLPIRDENQVEALGAIGAYWAAGHRPGDEDVRILQALADATSVALENLRSYRALEAGKARMRAIHDHMPYATFVWEREEEGFMLADFNEAAKKATEGAASGLIGKPARELTEHFPGIGEDVRQCFEQRAAVRREAQCSFPGTDASRRLVLTYGYVPDSMVILHAEDVTEHRKIEDQLKVSQKLDAIGQLAGGVAHDFNNLVTVIITYTGFAIDQLRASDPMQADLIEVQKAGERAATLTRQLLAFSRKQILEPEILTFNEVIEGIEGLLRRLLGEDIEILVRTAEGLACVEADPGQIEQVIMNLAVNARDAMPRGGQLTIETRNAQLDETYAEQRPSVLPGRYAVLSVSDTGCGMDAQTRECLFEPFFTTKEHGTGLGLATVYGIVKQSGGHISVHSEPDRGSVFEVHFPVVDAPSSPHPRRAPPFELLTGDETLLLVEDEEPVRRLAERILDMAGYRVLSASDRQEALHLCSEHEGPIHLLLADVVMPQGDGQQIAEQLGARYPRLKVLYMSGYTDDAIVRHGVLTGEVRFLGKPFTATELTRKVRQALDD